MPDQVLFIIVVDIRAASHFFSDHGCFASTHRMTNDMTDRNEVSDTLIIAALFCSTAVAAPEPVTCDSPCDCHNAHGEGRWSVKTDASLPPTDASAIQAVTPSEMFGWPGPDAA